MTRASAGKRNAKWSDFSLQPSTEPAVGQIIGGQRRILHDPRHRLLAAVPIDVEAVEIQRVRLDVAGGPDEKGIVDVNGLAQKRQEAGQGESGQEGHREPRAGFLPFHP